MVSFTSDALTARALILGGAIGDAYGAPFEYGPAKGTFTPSWTSAEETGFGLIGRAPKGTWTDDTSMTIATIDSLHDNNGNVNTADMLTKYANWISNGDYTIDGICMDYGRTTIKAVTQGHGCNDAHSNGNGSLMRISPLALTNANDNEIMQISATTHAHPIAMQACVQWVHALRLILNGKPAETAFTESSDYMLTHGLKPVSERFSIIGDLPISEINGSGYVVSTMEAAAWSVINSHDYESAVYNACSLGGDTDTIACIAGSAAGIIYGLDNPNGIPSEWVHDLRGMNLIDNAINELITL